MKCILTLLTYLFIVSCLTACGKTVEISTEASDITISDCEEISFEIKFCTPDAVTYTVCSSKENFLFYEGHQFAYVEKYVDGGWYSLIEQSDGIPSLPKNGRKRSPSIGNTVESWKRGLTVWLPPAVYPPRPQTI